MEEKQDSFGRTKADKQKECETFLKWKKTRKKKLKMELMEKLYSAYVPIISVWARRVGKYAEIHKTEEELFSDFSYQFIKALHSFKTKKKGGKFKPEFNIHIWYSFDWFFRNLLSRGKC